MANIIELSNLAYEARDNYQMEIAAYEQVTTVKPFYTSDPPFVGRGRNLRGSSASHDMKSAIKIRLLRSK